MKDNLFLRSIRLNPILIGVLLAAYNLGLDILVAVFFLLGNEKTEGFIFSLKSSGYQATWIIGLGLSFFKGFLFSVAFNFFNSKIGLLGVNECKKENSENQ